MKFLGKKELAFISRITKELVQGVVGQEVVYYEVLAEKTRADDLYNEAIRKVYAQPVKLNALVYYENSTEQVTNLPADSKFNVDVHFHTTELTERKLAPKMGDFVQFGEIVYEIYTVTQPQIIGGMVTQKVMTKCTCGPARQGQFGLPKQTLAGPGAVAPKLRGER